MDVMFVDDEKLPAGHDWMLFRDDDDHACVFVRQSIERSCGHQCGSCPILAKAELALRELGPQFPAPRVAV